MILAEKRVYEVVFIIDPDTGEEDVTRLTENLQHIITEQGGEVTKTENMGRRQLAYRIGRKNDGLYMLFEVEGTGREIAELERRMRVNDQVLRYLTVRVDEDRRRAEKLKARRANRTTRRTTAQAAAAAARGGGSNNATSSNASAARSEDEA